MLAQQHKDPEYYKNVVETIEKLDITDTSVEFLLNAWNKHRLLKEISLTAYDVTEGRNVEDKLLELIKEFSVQKEENEQKEEFEFVTDDIDSILNETFRQSGLRWRLSTLNQMLGSIRPGDFGFIFARPETGKTTFLASEASFMAEQLTEEQGPILWLNNEEQSNKVKLRIYQAATGLSLAQINANPQAAKNVFLQKTRGKLFLLNPKGSISKDMVERLCRQYKPSLVIFDQIDKVTGFDADREDLKLGAMYQWARELAKTHNCPIIAVCQADATGEGVKWLTMANVANAKTAKQAEADFILGIGKIHDPGYENLRFLHLSKNKLSGDPDTDQSLRHGKREVLIRADIARYEDIG